MKARYWIASLPLIPLVNQLIILGMAEALYIPTIHGPVGPSLWQPHSTPAIVLGWLITLALCTLAVACFWAPDDSTANITVQPPPRTDGYMNVPL